MNNLDAQYDPAAIQKAGATQETHMRRLEEALSNSRSVVNGLKELLLSITGEGRDEPVGGIEKNVPTPTRCLGACLQDIPAGIADNTEQAHSLITQIRSVLTV